MKIEMKIGRYVKQIGEDDLILDNGSLIQVVTQSGAYRNWSYSPLLMSKKLFDELKKSGFIHLDEKTTEKKNAQYKTRWLYYYRFDIQKMAQGGYKAVEEEK